MDAKNDEQNGKNDKQEVPKDLGKHLVNEEIHETTVFWFNEDYGYGFLHWNKDGIKDLYFHYSDIQMEGYKKAVPEQKMRFQLGECMRRKNGKSEMGPCALNVEPMETCAKTLAKTKNKVKEIPEEVIDKIVTPDNEQ